MKCVLPGIVPNSVSSRVFAINLFSLKSMGRVDIKCYLPAEIINRVVVQLLSIITIEQSYLFNMEEFDFFLLNIFCPAQRYLIFFGLYK